MSRSSGSTTKPPACGSIHSALPDTLSTTTRSPESIVSTGSIPPSKNPQWIVSGRDGSKCVLAVAASLAKATFIARSCPCLGLFCAARDGSGRKRDAVFRDLARPREPDPALLLVLGAMLDRLPQRPQPERLA